MTTMYVATGANAVIAKATAEGWHCRIALAETGIRCLAVHPHDGRIVYAGSQGQGVYKTTDGGKSWVRLPFPAPDVFSLAISSVSGTVYAGCEPSRLYYSDDEGTTWHELEALQHIPSRPTWTFPPRPWTSHVRWIAPHPQQARVLLVGIELGGIMYTDDGGLTWRDHADGAIKDCHSVAWHPLAPNRAYETGGGGPAARSDDGGHTWQLLSQGTDQSYGWALALDANDPDHWYMSAASSARRAHGDNDAEAHIYRWEGQGPWQKVTARPFASMPYTLQLHDGTLYAGFRDGSVKSSDDRGVTWSTDSFTGDPVSCIRAMQIV